MVFVLIFAVALAVTFLGLRVLRGAWHLAVAIPWWAWLGLIGVLVVAANLAHRT